jgi:hypothetical protein
MVAEHDSRGSITTGLESELGGVVRLVGGDVHVDVADHQMAERWSRLPRSRGLLLARRGRVPARVDVFERHLPLTSATGSPPGSEPTRWPGCSMTGLVMG